MTPREQLIEAMATGLAEARMGKGAWAKMPEAERNLWRGDVEFGAMPALAATLPAHGLKIMPVVATSSMVVTGGTKLEQKMFEEGAPVEGAEHG